MGACCSLNEQFEKDVEFVEERSSGGGSEYLFVEARGLSIRRIW